ncbi:MAG TPA: aminotransferase class V-fold PLP-dependent enzyme [Acidiphilium sp.]|nr:MAG: cysteine desulfurase [Acidiphilium sp. 21-60-14]OYV92254.1 MAG: cysteine desulfurase [Acidiphilium sp. 37-60-79]OZB40569.1 MAG: cysteine desulfurase [Acidiphilium sp. 34-60-192]HQT87376.1 aminotransferase class V-fold PLP-dependent enzyme [Acidiphilium sp.]HQU24602.1 aminotransferase class V-fold PLP-dependent enzyme [Acidiphilium sp.]
MPATNPLYLDANASETLRPAARAAILAALDAANPASIHQFGRAARHILEKARETIAQHCHARPQDLIFTSGATEANALAIHALGANRPILIGATEHDAIRAPAEATGRAITVPVTQSGIVDLAALERLLADHPGALVCLMAANNETGVLHPIQAIATLCAAHQAMLHVDAAQSAGRIDADPLGAGATSLALSSHKLGGPKGAGALIMAPTMADRLPPLIIGGGQERGRRGGTPDLPAIAGFAAAITAIGPDEAHRLQSMRDLIEDGALALGAEIIGHDAPRLPNTTCLAVPLVAAQTQVIALDLAGIAVSAGSACSSGKVARSHVLDAMGLDALAGCAIRVSLPWNCQDDAPARFLAAYQDSITRALHKADRSHIASAEPVA